MKIPTTTPAIHYLHTNPFYRYYCYENRTAYPDDGNILVETSV